VNRTIAELLNQRERVKSGNLSRIARKKEILRCYSNISAPGMLGCVESDAVMASQELHSRILLTSSV
jgi:hypothetical protein